MIKNNLFIGLIYVLISAVILQLDSPVKWLLFILVTALVAVIEFQHLRYVEQVQLELESVCDDFQDLLNGQAILQDGYVSEDMFSKLRHNLYKYVHIIGGIQQKDQSERERLELLIGDISHQLKTPIANLKLYQDLFKQNPTDEFLCKIVNQTEKLEWLVESLMKLSRIESGCIEVNCEYRDINQTILEAIGLAVDKAMKKGITIVYQPRSVEVYHDAKWSTEAIFNVLDNAIKYSNTETTIRIEYLENEMFHTVTVTDEGIGISEDEINNIFKRFYKGERSNTHEGVGVGLYLSQYIMNKQQGYVYCRPLSHGSEFTMNFKK